MLRSTRAGLSFANVVSVLALFVALATGTAYAANTIFSTDIVDGQVKTVDLDNGAVAVAKIADGGITGDKVKDGAIQSRDVLDNNLKGVDIDESTLSNIGGGGPAGGDLTGTYPNPTIRANAVGGAEVTDDSLTGFDILNKSIEAVDIEGIQFFDSEDRHLSDTTVGATEVTLIDAAALVGGTNVTYTLIGRCTEAIAGAVEAQIAATVTGSGSASMVVDSTGPGGVDNDATAGEGVQRALVTVGPTEDPELATGDYTLLGLLDGVGAKGLQGQLYAAANVGSGGECRFGATGLIGL